MELNTCKLRTMQLTDLDCVVAIEQSLQTHPWKRSHFENCLSIGNAGFVVENENQNIIAYAVVSIGGGEAELLNIGVEQKSQNLGLATHLIRDIITYLSQKADALFLEVRESNQAAIHLYHKLGFNQVGERPNYYPAKQGREDALLFALELSAVQHN